MSARSYAGWNTARSEEILPTLTPRDHMLMAAAYQAGRNAACADLYTAMGIGATFKHEDLERWRQKQIEYDTHALTDDQRDKAIFYLMRHENDYKPRTYRKGQPDEYTAPDVTPPYAERLPEP